MSRVIFCVLLKSDYCLFMLLARQSLGEVTPTRELAIAVCAQTIVKANSKAEAPMEFALAWDMPIVQFGARKRNYRR